MNNPLFIIFHSTYTHIIIGLFQGALLLDEVIIDHKKASKIILIHLEELLKKHQKSLADCSFIAAHTGPGPFTTLRVLISLVNGLAYASKIPLVGVDGLLTLVNEFYQDNEIVIALLNAFCNDVYYAIRTPSTTIMGSVSFEEFMISVVSQHLEPQYTIKLVGNAVSMYKDTLVNMQRVHILDPLPQTCSLHALALTALQHWHDKHNIAEQLLPNYLKSSSATLNPTIVS